MSLKKLFWHKYFGQKIFGGKSFDQKKISKFFDFNEFNTGALFEAPYLQVTLNRNSCSSQTQGSHGSKNVSFLFHDTGHPTCYFCKVIAPRSFIISGDLAPPKSFYYMVPAPYVFFCRVPVPLCVIIAGYLRP